MLFLLLAGLISTTNGTLRFAITSVPYGARNVSNSTEYIWVSDPTSAYSIHETLDSITTYQDGGAIGNTKYFNVVIYGLVEDEINGQTYYFNVQDEPALEYNSVSQAETDVGGKTNYQCPTRFARTCFPIARVVLKRNTGASTNEIQTLSSGLNYIQLLDQNLIIFGGTSAVALGLDEVVENNPNTDNNIISTANITAQWFLGIYNWIIGLTSTDYLSFNGTDLNFNETKLNETIGIYNATMKGYVDSLDTSTNTSLYNWVVSQSYIDWGNAVNGTLAVMADILGFGYYNQSNFNISDYLLETNQTLNGNYSASVDFCIASGNCLSDGVFTEVDPFWSGNLSNVAFTNVAEVFSNNVTMEGVILEKDTTNHRIYDNATCVFIKSDTVLMELC